MKKNIIKILTVLLIVINIAIIEAPKEIQVTKTNFYEGNNITKQKSGEYTSIDGKKIIVNDDNTILYENSYSLTLTESSTGNTMSGKIGTNKKTASFYQLNDSTIVSDSTVQYTHNSTTNYLNEHTIFHLASTPTPSATGKYQIYRNNNLVNAYDNFQDAVNAANNNDTIRINDNIKVSEGVYINKNLTIDGKNHTLDKSGWSNSLFVIEEGITVNIKNLTIDGGSEFEIDYSLPEPALKTDSITNSPISKKSIIISKGNLNINTITIKNNYFTTSSSTINIARGNATILNSDIYHNYGTDRAVGIRIGSKLRNGETSFPTKDIKIDKCNINENFTVGGSGGAVIVNFTENIKITNTNFKKNVASTTSSGGGAIYFEASSVSVAESNNIEYTQAYFDNCYFEQNYCGNDGLALSSDSAELYITNSEFINNIGTGGTNCVGTVSCMLNGSKRYDVIIKDTLFKNNYSEGVSVFGDHGTPANLNMENVRLEENKGNISVLLYSAMADIKNVTAVNETANTTVFDIRPYRNVSSYPLYTPQYINFSNVNITGTMGPTDILLRKYQRNQSYNPATAVIKDKVVANIDLWDNTYLNVEGTLVGNVSTDYLTPKENVTISKNGKISGKTKHYPNTYVITLSYPSGTKNVSKFLYLEQNKQYNYKELYNYHKISKEDYKLEFYTDTGYTTIWDKKVVDHQNIYARFIEHQHVYDETNVVIDNGIYKQCECGHPKLKLALKVAKENQYTGKKIPVTVIGDTSINDYKLKYYEKSGKTWKLLSKAPKDVGEYKAVLTYDGLSIEAEYRIQKELINPTTATNGIILVIMLVLVSTSTIISKKNLLGHKKVIK